MRLCYKAVTIVVPQAEARSFAEGKPQAKVGMKLPAQGRCLVQGRKPNVERQRGDLPGLKTPPALLREPSPPAATSGAEHHQGVTLTSMTRKGSKRPARQKLSGGPGVLNTRQVRPALPAFGLDPEAADIALDAVNRSSIDHQKMLHYSDFCLTFRTFHGVSPSVPHVLLDHRNETAYRICHLRTSL